MSDRTDDSPIPHLPPTPDWPKQVQDSLRRLATGEANIALLIESVERNQRKRHEEVVATIISLRAEIERGRYAYEPALRITNEMEVPRKHHAQEYVPSEDSAKIVLPGGSRIEVTRADLWKLAKILIALALAAGGWFLQFLEFLSKQH